MESPAPPVARDVSDVRWVAFDLDCTLVDILRVKERAAEGAAWALADEGLDLDPAETAREMFALALGGGLDADDVPERWLRGRGHASERLARLACGAYSKAEERASLPYPRVRRTLAELSRRGYGLALITDADRPRAERRLRGAGLAGFFAHVITREDSPHGKEGPEPYLLVARRTGAPPGAILMVGDNPKLDVRNARARGLWTALAAYGLTEKFRDPESERLADLHLLSPDQLLAALPETPPGTGPETPISPPGSPEEVHRGAAVEAAA